MNKIEEVLKEYYKTQQMIEQLKGKYDRLSANIKEMKQCISNTRHTLDVTLPTVNYENTCVSESRANYSPQENALLKAERRLENRIQEFQEEQSISLLQRYELEAAAEEIKLTLMKLEEDEQTICELRYKVGKSMRVIGYEIQADHSTVCRRLKVIQEKIGRELGLSA